MKAALLTLALLLSCQASQASTTISLASGSVREAATVYLPNDWQSKPALPVVLLLHGYLGNSFLMNYYFGLDKAVDEKGFILVVPNGFKNTAGHRYWDGTEACCDFEHTNPQDAEYLKALVAKVNAGYHGDKNKFYVAGHSNGAFMAHRLACDPTSGVSKIVSFAGEIFKDRSACKANHPVDVLQIQALDDDTIHYQGDPVGYPNLAPYPGAEETVAQWVALNGCKAEPVAGPAMNLTRSIPGMDATSKIYNQCKEGSRVELVTIRAYHSFWHFPHTPLLRPDFTDGVVNFLFSEAK